uniref:Uncharacterized protein n=1 Tax=Solanum lycopersicum TaxID=4081 RepID=A0A3Q7JCZ7_SOLLC
MANKKGYIGSPLSEAFSCIKSLSSLSINNNSIIHCFDTMHHLLNKHLWESQAYHYLF